MGWKAETQDEENKKIYRTAYAGNGVRTSEWSYTQRGNMIESVPTGVGHEHGTVKRLTEKKIKELHEKGLAILAR